MEYLIITFERTIDALAFARTAEAMKMRGRLGPVPRALQVSCGLAWRAPAGDVQAFRRMVGDKELATKDIVVWEVAS